MAQNSWQTLRRIPSISECSRLSLFYVDLRLIPLCVIAAIRHRMLPMSCFWPLWRQMEAEPEQESDRQTSEFPCFDLLQTNAVDKRDPIQASSLYFMIYRQTKLALTLLAGAAV